MKRMLRIYTGFFFVLMLVNAWGQGKDLSIELKPVFGKKQLVLEKEKYITGQADTIQVDLLRFYISSLELTYEDGSVFSEINSYHLVDASKEESLRIFLKNIPPGVINGIRFNIGVDSTACVSGALEGDLDPVNGMYWAWNSGYINAKLEGRSSSCKTLHQAFEFHIGGYLPKERSLRKTAFPVQEKNNTLVINADVSCWFAGVQLQKTNSVMIPGPEAIKMAERYKNMFSQSE